MKMCDLEPDILPNYLIVILWKRPFWIYANEGEKTVHQRVSTFKISCIVLNFIRAKGKMCTMKCSFEVFCVP